jgi:hypothetical protein
MGMLASPTSNTLLTLHVSALDTLSSVYGIRPPASTVRSKIAQARALSQMFQASTVLESARRPVHWHALVLTTSCLLEQGQRDSSPLVHQPEHTRGHAMHAEGPEYRFAGAPAPPAMLAKGQKVRCFTGDPWAHERMSALTPSSHTYKMFNSTTRVGQRVCVRARAPQRH